MLESSLNLRRGSMDWQPLLEAHFEGGDVAPGRVRSRDIAEVMTAMEEIIAVMILSKHSKIDIKKESIILGLKEIKEGSLELCFDTNDYDLSSAAANDLKQAFETGAVINLPLEVKRDFEKIIDFNKKYGSSFSANLLNGRKTQIFVLTPETKIPYIPFVRGETTLYGEITRVGGTDKPRIQFKTINGQTIYCDSDKQIAIEAGKLLYHEVALRGISEWNPEDGEIKNFTVEQILDYRPTGILNAFQKLSTDFGDAFLDIRSVENFVSDLRRN